MATRHGVLPLTFAGWLAACGAKSADVTIIRPHAEPSAAASVHVATDAGASACWPSRFECRDRTCTYVVDTGWKYQPLEREVDACSKGTGDACEAAAQRYVNGDHVAFDEKLAHDFYERACRSGTQLGCVNALLVGGKPDLRAWSAICDQGAPEACVGAARTLLGDYVHDDPDQSAAARRNIGMRTAALLKGACERGLAEACLPLGHQYEKGWGVEKDEVRAFELANRACDCNDDRACASVAFHLRDGSGVGKDEARATAQLTKLCDRDVVAACVHLGTSYRTGKGEAVDLAKATKLYEWACDHRRQDPSGAAACFDLGRMYQEGQGVAKDEHRAAELFDEGCSSGDDTSCQSLGLAFRDGRGVPADPAKAVRYLGYACKLGVETACTSKP